MSPASSTSHAVGDLIRAIRRQEGMTQEQLAHLLNRRQATISAWESGRTTPGLEDLYDLGYLLGRDVYEFLPRRREEPPRRSLMRAIEKQLPLGARLHAALELFIRNAGATPPPSREIVITGTEPVDLAAGVLRKARVTVPPVDVFSLAKKCGSRVVGWEAMEDAISGLLVQLEDGPLIAFNAADPGGRQRFTVAHELGHLLLNHLDQFHVDLSSREADPAPGYHRNQEKQANSFAAALLMPEAWVKRQWSEGKSLEDVASRVFGVSELAFGYRLRSLGLHAPTFVP